MKIVELRAENFKRLHAVEIKPNGNLVEICGRNGQGKTSVLDSIWVALAGKDACPKVPIRNGQQRARIVLDLGEIIITRMFRKEGDGYTTSITVESAQGARFASPQKMLDTLLGELSFDPLAFARAKPREQFDTLRRFVPGVDFDSIENLNRGDFDRRTELNRFAKQERAAAMAIVVPVGTPEEEIDEAALATDLEQAGQTNATIERRRANREKVMEEIRKTTELANNLPNLLLQARQDAEAVRDEQVGRLERQIEQLKAQITDVKATCDRVVQENTQRLKADSDAALAKADDLKRALEEAGPLPPPVDTAAITKRLNDARVINKAVRDLSQRMKHHRRAEDLQSQADALTAAIDKRNADKQAAIAAAKMPVAGIEFGDGIVLLNKVPFEQASDAEQLRASVAIAMAMNPKLRVLRIRDGSLLDEDSMRVLGEMCGEHDFQCWLEKVDSTGRIGFVLENGELVSTPATREVPVGATA